MKTLDDDARVNSLQRKTLYTRVCFVWVFSVEWIRPIRPNGRFDAPTTTDAFVYHHTIQERYLFIRYDACVVCCGVIGAGVRRRRRMRDDALEAVSAWRERRRLETMILSWWMGPGGRATVLVMVWMSKPMVMKTVISTEASLR